MVKALFLVLILLPQFTGCRAESDLTLAFLGDLNLARDVTPGGDSLAYLKDELVKADLVLANLESPLGARSGAITTGYNLCASAEKSTLLETWGIDLLSLENNHSRDCSPSGMAETQSSLITVGLIGLTNEPYRVEINDNEITFFAFDDIANAVELDSAISAIAEAHSRKSVVVVSIHWGMEYQGAPSERQNHIAEYFSEAGADIIWGHHPHVLQKVEWLETSHGHSLIMYSLGNALFDQGGLQDTRQSALLLVKISGGIVKTAQAFPFEIDVPSSVLISPSPLSSDEILSRLAIPAELIPSK